MIQCQLKLKLTPRQERQLDHWLRHLTGVWNWAIKKIENDARDRIYYHPLVFQSLLSGHSQKIGVPSHVMREMLSKAYQSWRRCFDRQAGKPRLKGRRNRLAWVPL